MKKLSAILITLILLISCCIIGAMPTSAAELSINYDDFDIMDGVILEYLGTDSEVIVPAIDADGNPITRIDSRAFRYNKTLEKVYICEGITEIGAEAFEYCVNLTEASLPYSLEKVEYSLLRKCSIASLVIPGKLKEIPQGIIVNATIEEGGLGIDFTDIVISPGVEKILTRSLYFYGSELVVPDTVFLIEGAAWRYVHSEVSVYICNPDCLIGTLSADQELYYPGSNNVAHTFSGDAPIVVQYNNDNLTKIYASKEATTIKEKVNEWNTTYGGGFVFVGQDQAKLDELNQKCAENGTIAPTKWNHNSDEDNSSNGGTANNNNNNNGNNAGTSNNNATGMSSGTLIILAVIALVIVIIIAVVIIVVVMANKNNKKKKKKKKVKVQKEETTAEEPIESTKDIE